jgi:(2Fe-2S) ferredoxin
VRQPAIQATDWPGWPLFSAREKESKAIFTAEAGQGIHLYGRRRHHGGRIHWGTQVSTTVVPNVVAMHVKNPNPPEPHRSGSSALGAAG